MDAGFLTATLTGTEFETLAIQYHREDEPVPDANCAKLVARLQSRATAPTIDQTVETWTSTRPAHTKLTELLDGDTSMRFVLESHNFNLEIYEHKWGVRHGFIAECAISTIKLANFAPWPKRRKIGDYILDGNPTAGCLKFAFLCEHDALRKFERDLKVMVAANQLPHVE